MVLFLNNMYKKNLSTYNKKTKKLSTDKINTLKRAIDKIKLTIYYVYDNKIIEKEVRETRKHFKIPNNFFIDCGVNNDSNNLRVLLGDLIIHYHSNNKEAQQIVELDNQVFNNKNFDKYSNKQINSELWRLIIGARLFGVPKKRLLACMSNMLDYYFPTVTKDLKVQVYESTTIDEIKYVWSDIEEIQNIKKLHEKKKGKFEYPKYNRDKQAYELSLKNKSHDYIAKELNKNSKVACGYADVPKFIEKYKKFIEEIW